MHVTQSVNFLKISRKGGVRGQLDLNSRTSGTYSWLDIKTWK